MNTEGLKNKSSAEEENNININIMVNGQSYSLAVHPTYRLVDILRNDLDLTGTKISCEIGRCGACSVVMEGNLVNACLVMAYQVDNQVIETIEQVAIETIHPIQQAFLEEGALQCGYCTPGMVIALKSLLDKNNHPTEEEVLDYLSGNLCRCTGYNGILRAVQRYKNESLSIHEFKP
jgi:xanthine dehydrogenase E subunit